MVGGVPVSDLLQPLVSILNMIVSIINGVIVGTLHFVLNLLDGLDDIDSLLEHAISSIKGFFDAFLNLGTTLFPFLPPEWSAIIQAALIVLALGIIVRKKVVG